MISNPARVFVTGNETKEFTYEGGEKLFHFSPMDCGLSDYRNWNVVFFANDEEHALDVLKRVLVFHIGCTEEFDRSEAERDKKYGYSRHREYYNNVHKNQIATCRKYLDAIKDGKVHASLAPTDQFYKIGWACNDNLL